MRNNMPQNLRQYSVVVDEDTDEGGGYVDSADHEVMMIGNGRSRVINYGTARSTPPQSATFINITEKLSQAACKSPGTVISSAPVSHLPAQDSFSTTQAFLCDEEEII